MVYIRSEWISKSEFYRVLWVKYANNEICEMKMDEIINGSNGLKYLVINYLDSLEDIDILTRQTINHYIEFISQRAKGNLLINPM
ncbi:hypothetical protein I4U23_016558 [Adineta vaga]|nr:hypothetical protein I4U23_016558 [Adineta vaga]